MFDVDCPRHDCRVLLGRQAIEALVNAADGVNLHWRCYCGARGTRSFRRPAPVSAVA